MNEIFWPEDYIPGFTDNFASNEVIVAGLSAMDVWPFLSNGGEPQVLWVLFALLPAAVATNAPPPGRPQGVSVVSLR